MDFLESIKFCLKLLFSSYNCYLYDFDYKILDFLKIILVDNKRDEKENIFNEYIIFLIFFIRIGMGNVCKVKLFLELYF